eukprot:CAMPEP_0201165628 /NCGR_PEP_ID=MMETSP0851-20130426/64344_1 /ASSEMBLY_ACC=CAM_ASM_000631 /TAXON_ID=183588 /ORGANISM="Pseudo-nitzschia fraudulenta, Strain WWA7" /LENGTH=55 /DNA_ID=CAMNT_0047446341 /DNA_START=40 /DNA_END=204 /DNA_ORIENTATION=-
MGSLGSNSGAVAEWGRCRSPSRGTSRVPLPSCADNMGCALNASSEASTEVEVATC